MKRPAFSGSVEPINDGKNIKQTALITCFSVDIGGVLLTYDWGYLGRVKVRVIHTDKEQIIAKTVCRLPGLDVLR